MLRNHPNWQIINYLLEGMAKGYHIGMDPIHRCISCEDNMRSAYQNPQPVEDYLATELSAGRIAGPFEPHTLQMAQVSVIPKSNQSGKWRLILDLLSPLKGSVKDGIPKRLCSLTYASIDDVVERIIKFGQGCLLGRARVQKHSGTHRQQTIIGNEMERYIVY